MSNYSQVPSQSVDTVFHQKLFKCKLNIYASVRLVAHILSLSSRVSFNRLASDGAKSVLVLVVVVS